MVPTGSLFVCMVFDAGFNIFLFIYRRSVYLSCFSWSYYNVVTTFFLQAIDYLSAVVCSESAVRVKWPVYALSAINRHWEMCTQPGDQTSDLLIINPSSNSISKNFYPNTVSFDCVLYYYERFVKNNCVWREEM